MSSPLQTDSDWTLLRGKAQVTAGELGDACPVTKRLELFVTKRLELLALYQSRLWLCRASIRFRLGTLLPYDNDEGTFSSVCPFPIIFRQIDVVCLCRRVGCYLHTYSIYKGEKKGLKKTNTISLLLTIVMRLSHTAGQLIQRFLSSNVTKIRFLRYLKGSPLYVSLTNAKLKNRRRWKRSARLGSSYRKKE